MNTRSTVDASGITKRAITLNAADVTGQITDTFIDHGANKVFSGYLRTRPPRRGDERRAGLI